MTHAGMRRVTEPAVVKRGGEFIPRRCRANGVPEIEPRRDAKAGKPRAHGPARQRRHRRHRAEVDDVQFSARRKLRDGAVDHRFPRWDHRQRVRNENAIDLLCRRVRFGENVVASACATDIDVAEWAPIDGGARRFQHFVGNVHAEKLGRPDSGARRESGCAPCRSRFRAPTRPTGGLSSSIS